MKAGSLPQDADSCDCGQSFQSIADSIPMIADSLPSTVFRAHAALSMSSLLRLPDFSAGLRSVSPSSARRCAVCTSRSSTASAIVGSPNTAESYNSRSDHNARHNYGSSTLLARDQQTPTALGALQKAEIKK